MESGRGRWAGGQVGPGRRGHVTARVRHGGMHRRGGSGRRRERGRCDVSAAAGTPSGRGQGHVSVGAVLCGACPRLTVAATLALRRQLLLLSSQLPAPQSRRPPLRLSSPRRPAPPSPARHPPPRRAASAALRSLPHAAAGVLTSPPLSRPGNVTAPPPAARPSVPRARRRWTPPGPTPSRPTRRRSRVSPPTFRHHTHGPDPPAN